MGDGMENNRGSHLDLHELITNMAREFDINFVAMPQSWEFVEYPVQSPAISKPLNDPEINQTTSVTGFSAALADPGHPLSSLLLYETNLSLADAGIGDRGESPIVINEGRLQVNRESGIALSVFLLATDRVFEQLSALMSPSFYDKEAINVAWLSRAVSNLKGRPQFALSNQLSISME